MENHPDLSLESLEEVHIELLSIGHILDLSRISDSNPISRRNHTPATLSTQAQVTVASFGDQHDRPESGIRGGGVALRQIERFPGGIQPSRRDHP